MAGEAMGVTVLAATGQLIPLDGKRVALFPIDERLRYLIPFRAPEETAAYLRELRGAGHRLAVLADDGEKFGGWPGTKEWVYDRGWLHNFMRTIGGLIEGGEVQLSTLTDAIEHVPSSGIAYLPTASYREMEGWSLPPDAALRLIRLERQHGDSRVAGPEGALIRGSHWRNFLAKYSESNRMHKKMQALSLLLHVVMPVTLVWMLARLGYALAKPALQLLRQKLDPRRYNGAMFLGLNGIVVKSHGGTDALGFANAIGVAVDLVQQGTNQRITAELNRLEEERAPWPQLGSLGHQVRVWWTAREFIGVLPQGLRPQLLPEMLIELWRGHRQAASILLRHRPTPTSLVKAKTSSRGMPSSASRP
jgi:hypothetical protein